MSTVKDHRAGAKGKKDIEKVRQLVAYDILWAEGQLREIRKEWQDAIAILQGVNQPDRKTTFFRLDQLQKHLDDLKNNLSQL